MKKIFLLIMIFVSVKVFGQFPVQQTMGSAKTQVTSKGSFASDSGFVHKICFTDTTQANGGFIKNIPGIVIRTCDDNEWMRNNIAVKWVFIGGASGGIGGGEATITATNLPNGYWNRYKQFVSFNTDSIPQGLANLWYTDQLSRQAITLTTSGTNGAASYDNISGVLNIPIYPGGGSGSGISQILVGYGLNKVNDSTSKVDSSVLSLYYLRRKDSTVYYPYGSNPKSYLVAADIAGKQNQLSGTGYVKFSGTTPSYLTPTQATADLNLFTTSLQGLVPASGGSARKVLHADGTWKDTTNIGAAITDSLNAVNNKDTLRNSLSSGSKLMKIISPTHALLRSLRFSGAGVDTTSSNDSTLIITIAGSVGSGLEYNRLIDSTMDGDIVVNGIRAGHGKLNKSSIYLFGNNLTRLTDTAELNAFFGKVCDSCMGIRESTMFGVNVYSKYTTSGSITQNGLLTGFGSSVFPNLTYGTDNTGFGQKVFNSIDSGTRNNGFGPHAAAGVYRGDDNNIFGVSAFDGDSITASGNDVLGNFIAAASGIKNINSFSGIYSANHLRNGADNVTKGAYTMQGSTDYDAYGMTVIGSQSWPSIQQGASYGATLGLQTCYNCAAARFIIDIGGDTTAHPKQFSTITTANKIIKIGWNGKMRSATEDGQANIGNVIYGRGWVGIGDDSTKGNVGIGIRDPGARLHVLSASEQLRLSYADTKYLSVTTSSIGSATFNITGSTPVYSFQGGDFNVGIPGTSNANMKITTSGIYHQYFSAYPRFYIERDLTGSGQAGIGFTNGTNTAAVQGAAISLVTNSTLAFFTGNGTLNERMRLTQGGSLGIGVNNPQGNVHIASGSNIVAPLIINPGERLTIKNPGAVENDTTGGTSHLYWTAKDSTRYQLDQQGGGSFYDSTLMASVKRLKDTAAAIRSAIGGGGGGTVTSVSGTTNRITSTGGATPVIDISSSYVGQSSITTHGTITSGGLGTGAVIGGVTMTLGSDATGDLYYRNGSGILTRIAIGTSKQALHPNGSGAYVWRDTVTLDFDSIGDYTPTLYNTTNVTTSTAYPTMWQTQGGGIRITVTGQVLVDPSSTGAVVLGIEIPFATSLAQNYSLNGVAVSEITGEPAYITADTTNNRALLQFTATSTASRTYKITFTYDYAPS